MNFFNTLLSAAQSAGTSLEIEFVPSRFIDMLSYMGKGMLVIFVIIGILIGITMILNNVLSKKKDDNK